MIKKLFTIFCLISTLLFVGTAHGAINRPTAIFTGVFTVNPTSGIQLNARVNQVNYQDGTFTNVDTAQETIIGAAVNLSNVVYTSTLGGDYYFTDGTISISDTTGTFLSANLVHVIVSGNYINFNFDTKNLQNTTLTTTLGSRFINELNAALTSAGSKELAVSFTLELFTGSFDAEGFGNVQGLLDGAPIVFISEPKTIGFWKHQVNQNGSAQLTPTEVNALVTNALALDSSICNVYGGDATAFKNYLTETGRKDALGKAKQQLAALLMNFAANYLIDEVGISLPITQATTVGAALDQIECDIKGSVNLDISKSIADMINNGVGIIR
jgi:hypothetical protein